MKVSSENVNENLKEFYIPKKGIMPRVEIPEYLKISERYSTINQLHYLKDNSTDPVKINELEALCKRVNSMSDEEIKKFHIINSLHTLVCLYGKTSPNDPKNNLKIDEITKEKNSQNDQPTWLDNLSPEEKKLILKDLPKILEEGKIKIFTGLPIWNFKKTVSHGNTSLSDLIAFCSDITVDTIPKIIESKMQELRAEDNNRLLTPEQLLVLSTDQVVFKCKRAYELFHAVYKHLSNEAEESKDEFYKPAFINLLLKTNNNSMTIINELSRTKSKLLVVKKELKKSIKDGELKDYTLIKSKIKEIQKIADNLNQLTRKVIQYILAYSTTEEVDPMIGEHKLWIREELHNELNRKLIRKESKSNECKCQLPTNIIAEYLLCGNCEGILNNLKQTIKFLQKTAPNAITALKWMNDVAIDNNAKDILDYMKAKYVRFRALNYYIEEINKTEQLLIKFVTALKQQANEEKQEKEKENRTRREGTKNLRTVTTEKVTTKKVTTEKVTTEKVTTEKVKNPYAILAELNNENNPNKHSESQERYLQTATNLRKPNSSANNSKTKRQKNKNTTLPGSPNQNTKEQTDQNTKEQTNYLQKLSEQKNSQGKRSCEFSCTIS